MKIITPAHIEHTAWQGQLEPRESEHYFESTTRGGGGEETQVTIGEPVAWSVEAAMQGETGKAWTPPSGDKRYKLVRLAFTLHPPESSGTRYTEATLLTSLKPSFGDGTIIAHDLYPIRITTPDNKGKFSVGVGANLKFTEAVEVGGPKIGYEIEFQKEFPVVQAFGLGEHEPYWRFTHHSKHPLLGCLNVYLVIAVPKEHENVRLGIELIATLETRFGPLRLGTPQRAQDYEIRMIEM